jgi:CRP-like cAMP-binding protein
MPWSARPRLTIYRRSMSELSQSSVRNRLLAALPADAFALLRNNLEPVPLEQSKVIIWANAPIEYVYFLEAGVTSVVTRTGSGRRIEIGLVGRDGFAGVPVLLGADQTPHETFMQVGGSALRMRADALRHAVEQSLAAQRLLLRFVQVFHIQTAQTAACNGSHSVGRRLARWLLMCHDRLDGDELPLTHEFIAVMLAVRRPGVTEALQMLEREQAIRTERRNIVVLDRRKLEETAGDGYGVPEAEYERLIGPLR